jgi:hypothetical protein
MDAGPKTATISISLEHNDPYVRELYFSQFNEFMEILHATLEEEWTWQLHAAVADKTSSRIYKELQDVSVFNKEQWPDLISFFKPRIIALDAFWENAKYSFETPG